MTKKDWVIVRGGGDLATGTIHRLACAGFRVLVLETARPAAIRRQVSFCEAVYEQRITIEGKTGVLIQDVSQAGEIADKGEIPILVDDKGVCISAVNPKVVVDAIMAKCNLGTSMDMAPLTVALGPGFVAGVDVDAVIETSRGHNLGRIIRSGSAKPDTGIPGNIGGYTRERVIHADKAGIIRNLRAIGDIVRAGEEIAYIMDNGQRTYVKASITGILRGLIRDGYAVTPGFKIADIDPRVEEQKNCFTISDKSRCIAGSVLELVCAELI